MKYKVGDKVRIVKEKTGDEWNRAGRMDEWLGKIMTISNVNGYGYSMEEDEGAWYWYEEMIEGKAEMKKSDLIAGKHVVETSEGAKYLIFDSKEGKFMFGIHYGLMDLERYHEDLTRNSADKKYDITKVYELKCPASQYSIKERCEEYLTLVWERTELKEMTMAELEKELGYKVKIVKQHE